MAQLIEFELVQLHILTTPLYWWWCKISPRYNAAVIGFLMSDQGSEFSWAHACRGIEHRPTTAQANGLDERFNQNAITKYSQECRDEWDAKLIDGDVHNTSVQASMKYSPFEAMFGRVAHLPVDCNTDPLMRSIGMHRVLRSKRELLSDENGGFS